MRKRLSLLCICLLVFSIFAVAFHHHDDGCDRDDCPICAAALHYSSAEVAAPVVVIHPVFDRTDFFTPNTPRLIAEPFFSVTSSRAPPA
jgi:hypothetical protein